MYVAENSVDPFESETDVIWFPALKPKVSVTLVVLGTANRSEPRPGLDCGHKAGLDLAGVGDIYLGRHRHDDTADSAGRCCCRAAGNYAHGSNLRALERPDHF